MAKLRMSHAAWKRMENVARVNIPAKDAGDGMYDVELSTRTKEAIENYASTHQLSVSDAVFRYTGGTALFGSGY